MGTTGPRSSSGSVSGSVVGAVSDSVSNSVSDSISDSDSGLGFVVELFFLVLWALGKGGLEVCVLVVRFGGSGEYLGCRAVVGVQEAPALGSRALLGAGAGGGKGGGARWSRRARGRCGCSAAMGGHRSL